jgi:hypothetical protein
MVVLQILVEDCDRYWKLARLLGVLRYAQRQAIIPPGGARVLIDDSRAIHLCRLWLEAFVHGTFPADVIARATHEFLDVLM